MILWVLNRDMTREGLIENFESLIWAKRYWKCGDFELYLPASEDMLSLLKQDRYIQREDDDSLMIIEKIEVTTDSEDGNHLIVSGRSFESILDRRIVWKQRTYSGAAEDVIERLLSESMMNPTIEARRINHMGFSAVQSGSGQLRAQYTGTSIYEAVSELCESYGLGFKFGADLIFRMYKGTDRSAGQSLNPRVIFSPVYDNLLESDYYTDKKEYKTMILVAGEGEGSARKYLSYGTQQSGINRRELFVDARDVQSEDADGNVMTNAEYTAALTDKAVEQYSLHRTETEFSGTIDAGMTYEYRRDYDLGDIVTVENEYGMTENCRITEIIESWDTSGYKVVPTYVQV